MNKKIIAIVAIIALVAVLGVCLVACNADSYQKKLEKKGYTVEALTFDDEDAPIEWGVTAVKSSGLLSGDTVTIIKYKATDDAKKAEENAIKLYGKDGVYRTGKILIAGTKQGVKDAK